MRRKLAQLVRVLLARMVIESTSPRALAAWIRCEGIFHQGRLETTLGLDQAAIVQWHPEARP